MRRALQNKTLRLAVFAAPMLLTLAAAQPPRALGQKSSVDTAALQKCVKDNKKLDILFLVDVSASLSKLDGKPGSDPNALRVQALRAITQLLGTTSGLDNIDASQQKQINLAFLDFGQKVRYSFPKLRGWQSLQNVLNADNEDKIFDQYRWKKTDADTDYVRALDPSGFSTKKPLPEETGVMQVLERSSSPCRALMWFTDGKFDIDKGNHQVPWTKSGTVSGYQQAQAIVRSGRDYLCKNDPRFGKALVDVLRSSKLDSTSPPLFVGAIGLGKKEADFDLLRGVAEGSNSCGKVPASGQFVRASNPQDLLDALSEILLDPTNPDPSTCDASPTGNEVFRLGQSLQKVSLVVSGNLNGTDVSLVGPNSKKIPFFVDGVRKTSNDEVPGIEVIEVADLFTVSNVRYLMVTAELDPKIAGWSGDWGVEFCRANQSKSENDKVSVYVYGSLDLVASPPQLTVDRTKQIRLQIVGKGAATFSDTTDYLKFKNLSVAVNGEDVEAQIDSNGVIAIDFSPSKSQVGENVEVKVSTEPTFVLANEKEIPLDFPKWTTNLPVRAVPRTPYLEQISQWKPISKDERQTSATFEVHPGDEDGTICIDFERDLRLPVGLENKDSKPLLLEQSPSEDCFEMNSGAKPQKFELTLSAVDDATFQIGADSSLSFPIAFKASTESGESEDGSLAQLVTVISSGRVVTDWCRALLMALASLFLPLAILYGFNFFAASRLIVPDRYYSTRVRINSLSAQELTETGSLRDFVYDPDRARTSKSGRRVKSLNIENLSINGRLAASPFGSPFALATFENDVVIGPDGRSKSTSQFFSVDSAGRSTISLANGWFVVLDSKSIDASKADAKIYVFAENHRLLEKTAKELFKNFRDHVEVPLSEIRSSVEYKAREDGAKAAKDATQSTGSDGAPTKAPPTVSDGDGTRGGKVPTIDGLTADKSTTETSGGLLSKFRRKPKDDSEATQKFVPRDNGNSAGGDSKSPPML
jgi:hypothetical protein